MNSVGPGSVYVLCMATSLICTALLARAFRRSHNRLLLWSAASFGFLSLNNLLLVADLMVFPSIDLWLWRQAAAAMAVLVLIVGFIWETK